MSSNSKKILITGAAGFIGFHLTQRLVRSNIEVVGLDNFNDYYDVHLKEARAQHLQDLGITVHRIDLSDRMRMQQLVERHEFSHIVHLAAQAGVRYSLKNPEAYLQSNIVGFFNILEICRQFNGVRLVYASSSSVYGLNEKVPFSTEDRVDKQASFYGTTKRCNELMAASYHHLYKLPCIGLRFFTVYGPWGRPDMAYFSFTKAILEGKTIDVFHEGKLQRDFTYIDDIIDGVIATLSLKEDHGIYNLGNNHPETVLDLIRIIEDQIGKKAQIRFMPMQMGDVYETYADISHSKEILHFEPKTSLQQGMARFIDWYRTYYAC